MPNNQIKIGTIKSFARKGDRVTVYFANGKSDRFIAENDITSKEVVVMGDRAFSQDAAQQKLHITTRLFKSRNNYEEGGKYPYLSVFINGQNQLVVTYNGGQRTLGDLPFSSLKAVNLNRLNSEIFTGTILSKDDTKVISFSNQKIEPVVNIAILPNPWKTIGFGQNAGDNPSESNTTLSRKLLGNRIYDYYSIASHYAIEYLPQKATFIHKKYLVPFGQFETYSSYSLSSYAEPFYGIQGYFDLSGLHFQYDDPNNSNGPLLFSPNVSLWRIEVDPSLSRQVLTIAPQSYSWVDNRTITNYGTNPSSFSNGEINWSYAITGQVTALRSGELYRLYPTYGSFEGNTNQPPPVTDTFGGTLVKSIANQANNSSDIAIEFPTVFDADGSILGNTKITYKSNISRVANYNSNFAISGTSVTIWQHTFIQFSGYYYIPYTGTTVYYSGQADCSDITTKHIETELLVPVPTSDRRIVERRKYLKRDYSKTTLLGLTVNNSQIYSSYISSSPTPVNSYTTVSDDTIIYEDLDIDFNFNVGDLGIYREKKLAYVIKEDTNGFMSNFVCHGRLTAAPDSPVVEEYQDVFNHIELSARRVKFFDDDPPELFNDVTSSRIINNYSAYSIVKIKDISANFSFYKIAYLGDEVITAYPGYASSSDTTTPEKIANFFSNPTSSDPAIELSLYITQYVNYVSKETVITTKSTGQAVQSSTNYERKSYPELEATSVDLVGQYVVYKQTYQDNTYLALCRVNSVSTLYENNYGNTNASPDSKYLGSAQCTIISVKKIKSFFTPSNFIFTVDGCAIFQFLDPYKTSLITVENDTAEPDVYLATTMTTEKIIYNPYQTIIPTVTKKDTQALLFKLTPTGFSFVAVVGGDISDFSQEKSPDAAYWINYWDRPPASFW
jgi:hypothetical protein